MPIIRLQIACTLFEHKSEPKPCIVYSHSHSGNKLEGSALLEIVKHNFSLCLFDYTGYGCSQGQYSTLGLKEEADLETVINHLKKEFKMTSIYLWGRSMGAVTIVHLMSKLQQPPICDGIVLDAPFTSTKEMVLVVHSDLQSHLRSAELLAVLALHTPGQSAAQNHRS